MKKFYVMMPGIGAPILLGTLFTRWDAEALITTFRTNDKAVGRRIEADYFIEEEN